MSQPITYRELAAYIGDLSEEQKDCNVTVFVPGVDEYYPAGFTISDPNECDALDPNHPVIEVL